MNIRIGPVHIMSRAKALQLQKAEQALAETKEKLQQQSRDTLSVNLMLTETNVKAQAYASSLQLAMTQLCTLLVLHVEKQPVELFNKLEALAQHYLPSRFSGPDSSRQVH